MQTFRKYPVALGLIVLVASSVVAEETREERRTEPAPITLKGTGRQASKKFTLGEGLAVFRVRYEGDSNFIVQLINSDGEGVQTLFNHIDKLQADRGFEIRKAGEYLLDVQARGRWTFTIEQPRPTAGEPAPTTLTGKRSEVSPFLSLDKGLSVFRYRYQGDGRFAAFLTDANGRMVEQLVNTLKTTEGSTPVKVPEEGLYFINVTADAPWQIEVE
jgi:hypothetical protein